MKRIPIQEMRRMNRYYEMYAGIESDDGKVVVERGWEPESGSTIIGA